MLKTYFNKRTDWIWRFPLRCPSFRRDLKIRRRRRQRERQKALGLYNNGNRTEWSPIQSVIIRVSVYLCLGQSERLNQVPCKARLGVKVTKHLEGLIAFINDCVQSRTPFSCRLIGLAAFSNSFKLTVPANKLFWARTVVPNARGLTNFCARSPILTRVLLAAAIDARDITITWLRMVFLKKVEIKV